MKSLTSLPAPILVISLLGWLGATSTAFACEACNVAFTQEVLNERADTPVGRDLKAAMDRQRSLPLKELAADYYLAQTDVNDATVQSPPIVESSPISADLPAAAVRNSVPPPAGGMNEKFTAIFKDNDFIEVIERDYALNIPPTSYVPQDAPVDKSFTIELSEGMTYLGNGVVYDGFLTSGSIPGPTLIVDEGDIVEFIVVNKGNIPHGASIHAANTQTSKYVGKIGPRETKSVIFRATQPGVFMYHCAPGGHAIPMHVLFGQYGMIVVKPKQEQYQLEKDLGKEPDLELYLIQNEIYASGKDAISGDPAYVMFNGKLFRYIEEPIMVRPGDYVRIYFLNIGPNLLSTFHIVGIIWDYAYWQGHPSAKWPGGQSVTAGPTDSWVVEFRIPPDEGAYTMLSHVVGSTSRGAIGLLVADRNAETVKVIEATGPTFTEAEMTEYLAGATRVVSPFRPGTHPVDNPVVYGPETKEVHISIIGNSFHPKVVQVAPGTKITWTNEDVFAFFAGEYSGIHNAVATSAPPDDDAFVTPLLAHGESSSFVVTEPWEFDYICTPHPYMKGRIIVKEPDYTLTAETASVASLNGWIMALLGLCFLTSTWALIRRHR